VISRVTVLGEGEWGRKGRDLLRLASDALRLDMVSEETVLTSVESWTWMAKVGVGGGPGSLLGRAGPFVGVLFPRRVLSAPHSMTIVFCEDTETSRRRKKEDGKR
jgi:hypothetical protein